MSKRPGSRKPAKDGAAAVHEALLHISQNYLVAGARKYVRDAMSHGPRAQHCHCLDGLKAHG